MLSVFLPSCHSNPPISQIHQEPPTFLLFHHHVACPGNCLAHLTHTNSSIRMVPTAKIWSKARMVHLVGRCAPRMGSSGMFKVGSRCASCLDGAVVLGWVADVTSMC